MRIKKKYGIIISYVLKKPNLYIGKDYTMLILDDLKAELMTYKPQLDELHDVLAVEAAKEKLAELQMMV